MGRGLFDHPLNWGNRTLKELRSAFINKYDSEATTRALVSEVDGEWANEIFPDTAENPLERWTDLLNISARAGKLHKLVEIAFNDDPQNPNYKVAFEKALKEDAASRASRKTIGDENGTAKPPAKINLGKVLGIVAALFLVVVVVKLLIGPDGPGPDLTPTPPSETPETEIEIKFNNPIQEGGLLTVSWICIPSDRCEPYQLQYCLRDDPGEVVEECWQDPQLNIETALTGNDFALNMETNGGGEYLVGKIYLVRITSNPESDTPPKWDYSPEIKIADQFPPIIEVIKGPGLETIADPARFEERISFIWKATDKSGIEDTSSRYCIGNEDVCTQTCEGDGWKLFDMAEVISEEHTMFVGPVNYNQSYHFCLIATDMANNRSDPFYIGPYLAEDQSPPEIMSVNARRDQQKHAARVFWSIWDNNEVDIAATKLEYCKSFIDGGDQCDEKSLNWESVEEFSDKCQRKQNRYPDYIECKDIVVEGDIGNSYRFRVTAADKNGNVVQKISNPVKIERIIHEAGARQLLELELSSSETLTVPLRFVPQYEGFVLGSEGEDRSGILQGDKAVKDLAAYWIDEWEVTNALFAAFLNAKRDEDDFKESTYLNRYRSLIERSEGGIYGPKKDACERYMKEAPEEKINNGMCDDHPVVGVTWEGANEFCRWISLETTGGSLQGRLPTEHEWENAAKGGIQEHLYPWGKVVRPDDQRGKQILDKSIANLDDVPQLTDLIEPNAIINVNTDMAWIDTNFFDGRKEYNTDRYFQTAPVWEFSDSESKYGVMNMIGNVSEWTYTTRDERYPGQAVIRGFSYIHHEYPPYIEIRFGYQQTATDRDLGFRCAYPDTEPVLQN